MFRSLFGGKKRRRASGSESSRADESIGSARVGDVVVISGFSPTLEDAYVVTEKINRYESSVGKWYDLVGSDGDRPIALEWSNDGGLTIFVSTQGSPMALSAVGLTDDELVRMDKEQSLDNFLEYEGERYFYSNSYEVFRFEDDRDEGEGFYLWEFFTAGRDNTIAVVKWEGVPFEVYASEELSPDLVSVFKK